MNDLIYREAKFERAKLDVKAREADLVFSTETPIFARDLGALEVLDHSPGNADFSRLNGGAALLLQHDSDRFLGSVIPGSARVDQGRGRARVRISLNALGNELLSDLAAGITRGASVGYLRRQLLSKEKNEDGQEVQTFAWTPHELSVVSIPADPQAAVGRSSQVAAQRSQKVMQNSDPDKSQTPELDAREINARGAAWAKRDPRIRELADVAIREGYSLEWFQRAVLEKCWNAQPIVDPCPSIGMEERDLQRYSLCRAIMQLTNGGRLEGIEKEASDAVARKLNRPPEGFFIPHDVAARSLADVNGLSTRDLLTLSASVGQLQERVLGVSGFGSGGATVDTQVLGSALIELLRNRPLVAQMGAMTFSGLVGNIAVPRQTGAGTAYTLSEAAAVTLADQSFGQLGLSPKRVSGGTAYQKELLMQSSIDVEGFVRNDLLRIVLIKKDLLMLIGLGGAGEPIGILNTTGIGSETFGAAATWAKIVDFEKLVAVANADVGRIGWLTTPGVRAKWKQNAKIGSTFPNFIWEVGPDPRNPLVGTVNNYPAYVTNQVPGDQVLFGNFGDCLIGDWAGIDIVVDPYTQKKSAQVEIVINIWFDFGLRHAVSMVVSTDSGAQ